MELIDQFCRYQRGRGFSSQTVKRRRHTITTFARILEPKTLDRATTADIEEWLQQHRTPRTRHAYRSDLRVFYHWAVTRELLPTNPAALVDPVKVPRALPRPCGPEVMAAVVTGSLRVRRMAALGLLAGLRAGEIAALDASDVALHLDPPLLTVRNGKGGKDRVVPMHPVLVDLLRGIPDGPVFANSHGDPIQARTCSTTLREHLARCGVDAKAHQLRHTFGTEAARVTNGNVVLLAALMGHASTNTTMGYIGWTGQGADAVKAMFQPGRNDDGGAAA